MYANAIREHLLQNHAGHAAMVLDALALAGYQSGDELSVSTAMLNFAAEGIRITENAVRTGLRQLRDLKLLACRIHNNKLRGAPVTIYRLSPMNLIAEKLGVVIGAFDKITKAAVSKLRNYRSHLNRAFIARREGQYSRDFLGGRLGVSGRSTLNYEKDFPEIEVQPRFHETPITWDNLDVLPREAVQGPVFLRIHVEVPLTESEIAERYGSVNPIWRPLLHKTRTEERRFPAIRAIAVKLLREGHKVELVRQQTNYYRVKSQLEMLIDNSSPPYCNGEGLGVGAIPHPNEEKPMSDTTPNPNLDTIIAPKLTVASAWSSAYNQLELQLDSASFDTWLRKAQLTDYEADTNTFVVEVHSIYARDMLQHRLYRNVQRILRDVTGTEPIVRFITNAKTENPEVALQRFLAQNPKSK